MDRIVNLTHDVLDARAIEAAVAHPGAGAVCTFSGNVRDHNLDRQVEYLEYEAYAEMALQAMNEICHEVVARWQGARIAIVHRLGRVEIGEASVIIAVASAHRGAAFAACLFAIDTLKTTVPIWKREVWTDGAAWIEGVSAAPVQSNPFVDPIP